MSAKPVHPVSVVEAKARFSEVVREAEAGGIVVIRRHGRDVAAVVSSGEVERLRRQRSREEHKREGRGFGRAANASPAQRCHSEERSDEEPAVPPATTAPS